MSTAQKLASQTPARSLDQRMEALQRANVIRIARAQLKRDLKSGDGVHLGAPERPAGVGADGQGVRPPARGTEVRPREGGPAAHDLPHLAVEDGRRALRAPAGRARRAAAPVARAGRGAIAILFVISGPSGAGKGTLIRGVLDRDPSIADVAVSATTRPQRKGEVDGREYYFLSDAEFQRRVDADAFEEHVSFAGGRYGTLKEEVDRLLAAGRNVILELEVEGSFAIRRRRPDACLIFIDAPLPGARAAAARPRHGDARARSTCASRSRGSSGASAAQFDHVILNDDAARAASELYATMRSEISRREGGGPPPHDSSRGSMIYPKLDDLTQVVPSKYALVIIAAKRARQLNAYHHMLGEGVVEDVAPPLVESRSKNYLTMSLEEVAQDRLAWGTDQ